MESLIDIEKLTYDKSLRVDLMKTFGITPPHYSVVKQILIQRTRFCNENEPLLSSSSLPNIIPSHCSNMIKLTISHVPFHLHVFFYFLVIFVLSYGIILILRYQTRKYNIKQNSGYIRHYSSAIFEYI